MKMNDEDPFASAPPPPPYNTNYYDTTPTYERYDDLQYYHNNAHMRYQPEIAVEVNNYISRGTVSCIAIVTDSPSFIFPFPLSSSYLSLSPSFLFHRFLSLSSLHRLPWYTEKRFP